MLSNNVGFVSHTNVDSFVNKIEPNVVFNQAPMPVDALTQQGVVLTNNSDKSLFVFCVFTFLFVNCLIIHLERLLYSYLNHRYSHLKYNHQLELYHLNQGFF